MQFWSENSQWAVPSLILASSYLLWTILLVLSSILVKWREMRLSQPFLLGGNVNPSSNWQLAAFTGILSALAISDVFFIPKQTLHHSEYAISDLLLLFSIVVSWTLLTIVFSLGLKIFKFVPVSLSVLNIAAFATKALFQSYSHLDAFLALQILSLCSGFFQSFYSSSIFFSSWRNGYERIEHSSGEATAGLLSLLFFSWSFPLVWRGYRNGSVVLNDLFSIFGGDLPSSAYEKFAFHFTVSKSVPLALFNAHCRIFIQSGIYLLLCTIFTLLSPFMLELLLSSVQQSDRTSAFIFAFMLFLCSVLQCLLEHRFWIIGVRCGLRCQSSLMAAVTAKTLRISASSKSLFSDGEILTLFSLDACRVNDLNLAPFLHWGTWQPLIIVTVSLFALFRLLGTASFAGFVFLLFWPIGGYLSSVLKKYSRMVQSMRDERAKQTIQFLSAIRLIKALKWTDYLFDAINVIRESELTAQLQRLYYAALNECFAQLAVQSGPICAFYVYSFVLGNTLTPSIAFSSLAWFNIIRRPLMFLPNTLTAIMDCFVSFERLERYLNAGEKNPIIVQPTVHNAAVSLNNCAFRWTDRAVLSDITQKVNKGDFVFIIGSVGSGKSSLLSGILGECEMIRGKLHLYGSLSVSSQTTWLQQCTIRENILFGCDEDPQRLDDVMRVCAIKGEIDPSVIVAENGSNLSGGQRQRVCLARAVYCNADIYLMDDVLSALDGKVGAFVFENCLKKYLEGKTRIVVTHQTKYLKDDCVNNIAVLSPSGHLYAQGSYTKLRSLKDTYIQSILNASESPSKHENVTMDSKETQTDFKMTLEIPSHGYIDAQILFRYFKLFGSPPVLFTIILSLILEQTLTALNSYWLSDVTSSNTTESFVIWSALGISICFTTLLRVIFVNIGSRNASRHLHQSMLSALSLAPVSFFDTQPLGRTINRSIGDQSSIDGTVPGSIDALFRYALSLFGILFVISTALPWLLLAVLVLSVPYAFVSVLYRWSARDLRRLESISKSPLNTQFTELMYGLFTLRAFGREKWAFDVHLELSECSAQCTWNRWVTNQWVTVCLELIGNLVTVSAVFGALLSGVSASLVGLVVSSAIGLPGVLGWLLKSFVIAEVEFVALERVMEYIDLSPEGVGSEITSRPSIEMKEVWFRYSESSDYVLRGVTVDIPFGRKIVFVGQTGSGKSTIFSLLLQFYRLEMKNCKGEILIGGVAIGKTDSRQLIGYVPQHPQFLGSTIRESLCGPSIMDEDRIWQVLEQVGVVEFIQSLPNGLDHSIGSSTIFSAGQLQLLSIARVLLLDRPILLLDEISSSVDSGIDALLHDIVFSLDKTVIAISHRDDHLDRFDEIIRLSDGKMCQ